LIDIFQREVIVMSPKIMVLHGPNLNMLGEREPRVYGKLTLDDINNMLQERALHLGIELTIRHSNHEGVLVDEIQEAQVECSGLLINPGALSHYSYALRDALQAANIPVVEIHLSNIYSREPFRRHSVISPVVKGVISGFGPRSYLLGLEAVFYLLNESE